ncbi:hypothetical protein TNCT_477251 [Trichonephila clavata]|uniref:MADF domain-containing protein n=1 Tax=Trichonephila clavata TaxID=2740835 RepID=A0A8X6J1R8_TRICU|nr:hypothetical protein TNCT_477251 [Trichonephila clavata]
MDHFVKTVKSFPCLWDTTHPAYKDFEVMDQAWAKVAAAADYPDGKFEKTHSLDRRNSSESGIFVLGPPILFVRKSKIIRRGIILKKIHYKLIY